MSREIHIAIIEDSKGTHHQFDAPTEIELTGKIAGWVRKKWKKAWGDQPDDADDTVNEFFQKYALPPFVAPGWECELWRAEPVEIEDALPLGIKGPGQPPGFTYPMEVFINGELSFKLDTEDATGDLAAIKALMTWRTAKRENRPLTDTELYGKENPHDIIHRSPHGKTRVVPMSASPATVTQVWELPVDTVKVMLEAMASTPDGCTFKSGDKDPCPTCPRLITCLHSCGLLQDELHEAHGTGHAEPGGED